MLKKYDYPKYEEDTPQKPSDLSRLLVSYEKFLGLKHPSRLYQPEMATLIVGQGNSILGHMSDLLRRLAKAAIISGKEQITVKDLSPASLSKSIGWVHPNKRHVPPK